MSLLEVRCKECNSNVIESGFYMISKDVYKVSNRNGNSNNVGFAYSEDYDGKYYCCVCNSPIKDEDKNKLVELIEK